MSLTIRELCERYQEYAETYYRKPLSQRPTGEAANVRDGHRGLLALYADTPADGLRPRHLRRLQQYLASGVDPEGVAPDTAPVARSTVNQRINRIRRMYRWAAEHELVPDDLPHRLAVLSTLKAGRSIARETEPVKPVPWEWVEATLDAISIDMNKRRLRPRRHALEKLAVMIELHWHLGCRPGELVIMRKSSIDRGGDVWLYTPSEHKTEHHGHRRRIPIGPRAQKVLVPWWVKCPTDVLFVGRGTRVDKTGVEEPAPMSRNNYAQAVARVNRAHRLPHWAPNRIRHSAATRFREQSGSLDAVQALLGHKNADVTQVYAERNDKAAADLARMCG